MKLLCYPIYYPVQLKEAEDGITVTFPDMPYGVTYGDTKEDALLNAIDCLEEVITSLMKEGENIPDPSSPYNHSIVVLSPSFSAKVLLYMVKRLPKTKEK